MDTKELCRLSLDGLSTGDAIGEYFLREYPRFTWNAEIPPGPLPWTDDTQMAVSIVEELIEHSEIDQDRLAGRFAERFKEDPERGYSEHTYKFLRRLHAGEDWRKLSLSRFAKGSYGNGAAMRAAPIGAYFSGLPDKALQQARLSAEITHAHPEGINGAAAVALAACLISGDSSKVGKELLRGVLDHLPDGDVSAGIRSALEIPSDMVVIAIRELGTGYNVSAQDTVPFCLWVAAHNSNDYENALRITMQGMGDTDTTCAIVGGIVSLALGEIPIKLLASREQLPG